MALALGGTADVVPPSLIPPYAPGKVLSPTPISRADSVTQITAWPGDNVTLPCTTPRTKDMTIVEWTRKDLKDLKEYVYMTIDNTPELEHQHKSYENRVELKDGGPSLLLKNISISDEGIYECRYKEKENTDYFVEPVNDASDETSELRRRLKRATIDIDPVTQVELKVESGGRNAGNRNYSAGIGVCLLGVLVLMYFTWVTFFPDVRPIGVNPTHLNV